jgi:hypothetical protein
MDGESDEQLAAAKIRRTRIFVAVRRGMSASSRLEAKGFIKPT